MEMKANERVEQFMGDTLCADKEKGEILLSLRKMILKRCPDAQEEMKYGGVVFNAGSELICGLFVRQKHISLEFGFGNEFSDPKNYLEGSGKFRRHLKIMNDRDIDAKDVGSFVSQAFDR